MFTFYRIIVTAFVFIMAWLVLSLLLGVLQLEPAWLEDAIFQAGLVLGGIAALLVFNHPVWKEEQKRR